MTTRNDITGDKLQSKVTTDTYRDNWDKIFRKEEREQQYKVEKKEVQLEINFDEDGYASNLS